MSICAWKESAAASGTEAARNPPRHALHTIRISGDIVKHPIRVLAAVATIVGGAILTVPNAAMGQEAPNSNRTPALRCNAHTTYDSVNANCWRDDGGRPRGELFWVGDGGKEWLSVFDLRVDHRTVSAHVVWWQNGRQHHQQVTDTTTNGPNDGAEMPLGIPDDTPVHVYLCVEGIGCGEWYRSHA